MPRHNGDGDYEMARIALIKRRDNKDESVSLVLRGKVVFRGDFIAAQNWIRGFRSQQA